MAPKASVIIAAYNEESNVSDCIRSLLRQTIKDIEIIIVDDASSDDTSKKIAAFDDKRISYHRLDENGGPAVVRNEGIKHSRSKYLFFIDADCVAFPDWIDQGISSFRKGVVGVEGSVHSFSANLSVSHELLESIVGGQYFSGNIAYLKKALEKAGGFDDKMRVMEDFALALRIKKQGEISLNQDMRVLHKSKKRSLSYFLNFNVNYYRAKIHLLKHYGHKDPEIVGFVMNPLDLICIPFPFLLFLYYRVRSFDDLIVICVKYLGLIFGRVDLWLMAIKERIFIL